MGGCVSLDLSCDQTLKQTCNCLFGDGNYIHMVKAYLDALETTMQELRERRDYLLTRASIQEDRRLERLAQVEGWLSRVASIDSQFGFGATFSDRFFGFGFFGQPYLR
ncbi:hypothetical protein Bca4012_063993 [Brassica carinata]|uniref:Uncharacterized protein n=1 Tax=Brassica carinata TaxID=52824 RepID=A0A8X7SE21_BRACI|nr:hypothetical protein Bca52824_033501 [Brassica carinata]